MIISEKQARLLRELDIVFVDDNRAVVEIISNILKSFCVSSLRTASDGAEALALLHESPANLVITDLNMKPMNGLALTQKIRSGDGGVDPRTPVIALTGNSAQETIKAALLVGINGIMVKPVEPQAMVNRIDKVVSSRVIYQLRGSQYVAKSKATWTSSDDLVYDGLLPRVKLTETKTVEYTPDTSHERDAWVLD